MKADIHPKLHPVVFIDSSTGAEFITMTTIKTEETKKIKGVEHYVVRVDISSASHPFYTGKKTMVDTAGRVDKFRARMEAAKKRQEEEAARSKKRDDAKKETPEEAISRKAKVNTEKKEEEKAKKKAAAKTPAAKKAPAKKSAKEEEVKKED